MAPAFIESIDQELLADRFVEDPYPTYARLRTEDPVHWSEAWSAWVISRYAEVQAVLREDGNTYSTRGRIAAALAAFTPEQQASLRELLDHYGVGLLHSDPPDHTRQRALVNRIFNPRVVDQMRPTIRLIVDELLDRAADHGKIDLIREFAFPLPATVVADVLGIPREDQLMVKAWAEELNAFLGSNRASYETVLQSQASLHAMREYLTEIAALRLADPREDVISRLAAAVGQPEGISHDELLSTSVTILVGGHVTTTALISNGLLNLSRQPEQLAAVRADPARMVGVVEETLRYESPNQRLIRVARSDTELDGRRIRQGEPTMLLIGSANRDEAQFESADAFDSSRQPNRHLAFAMGEHFCIGASLARAEATIALNRLLERFPALRVEDGPPAWARSPTLRVMREMPVTLA
jgi:cytochrome P450